MTPTTAPAITPAALAAFRDRIDRIHDETLDTDLTRIPGKAQQFVDRYRADIADASYALNRAVDEYTLHLSKLDQVRAESATERRREHDLDARLEALAETRGGWRS